MSTANDPQRRLFFVSFYSKIVFTYSAEGDGTWRFSRLSACQRPKNVFVLVYRPAENKVGDKTVEVDGWVIQDRTPTLTGSERRELIGCPAGSIQNLEQNSAFPLLGPWTIWGSFFELTDRMPEHAPLDFPPAADLPFLGIEYSEDGNIARLDIEVRSAAIEDESFEQVLRIFHIVLENLAQRPRMVLLIRADARNAAVPAMRHIRRYLAFIQENGSEFILVGRGNAIVLKPRTVLGMTLVSIVRMVQKLFPPPWPEVILPTMEQGEAFLADLAEVERNSAVNGAALAGEAEVSDNAAVANSSLEESRLADSMTHAAPEVASSLPVAVARLEQVAASPNPPSEGNVVSCGPGVERSVPLIPSTSPDKERDEDTAEIIGTGRIDSEFVAPRTQSSGWWFCSSSGCQLCSR